MVYESRVGDVFALGTTSWRIEDITHDRVLVSPAPGQPGRLPFWKGDSLGRPAELGEAVGGFVREVAKLDNEASDRASDHGAGLDAFAAWQPGRLRHRAARRHRLRPPRPAAAGRALSRRARRLAADRALPLRRRRPRAVGAGDRRAAAGAVRHRRPGDGRRRRHRDPDPRDRCRAARCRAGAVRRRRDRRPRDDRGRRLGAVRLALPRVRRSGAAAAATRSRQALAAVAAAPALGGPARRGQQVRLLPDRARSGPRVPPGRLRPARAAAG